ncbi:luciferase-type oxidoreductase, BA3436 family [Saccharopolyspora antimicrobica]|uniref:Luciferase-type oxidoreductase n=1 Tax=Saccharopolyspora antimicrobica TaxID=455193 RepID=A0A1I5C1V3_9PSEU|nr:TIGR03571 family LLM class oxidoreductase [Saccharopolyspora antimicrobica]RKT89000.1 luciferase-type oxidoreductase [Saccharopolyspora antimicrobica]SFN80958.1 luciferase-type oxidoreductase, BA3436 family [Saccharopolyspora antimicrobica]
MPSDLTALDRLVGPTGLPTLGLELPLDNDWGETRLHADRAEGRPFGVPDLSEHARLAQLADDLGFAALWVRDVPLYDPVQFGDAGSVFETFTHLGHLAAITERAVLGTGAVVLPLRQPWLVAKAAATVDVLSGGRFVLGLASGDRPVEYPLFGLDFHARGAAFREGVEILRAAWAPRSPGEGIDLPDLGLTADRRLEVLPEPTGSTIPIAIAGSAQQSAEWIAENADASLNYPRQLGALRKKTAEWRQLTGDASKPYLTPMQLDLLDDPTADPTPLRLGMRTGRLALIEQLREMGELGVAHVSFNVRPGDRPAEEVIEELAHEVLPHFPTS